MRALGSWKGCKDHRGTGAGFQFRTLSLGTVEQGSLRGWETRDEAISIIQGRKSWGHQEETWAPEKRINVGVIREVQLTWHCPSITQKKNMTTYEISTQWERREQDAVLSPRDNVIPWVVRLDSKLCRDGLVWNEQQPELHGPAMNTYLSSVQPSSC